MPATLTVVLDSNVYIFGIARVMPSCEALLNVLSRGKWEGRLRVITPHLVEREVTRNLEPIGLSASKLFYSILADVPWSGVIYEAPPDELMLKYLELGLAEEDAVVAAFTEWLGAKYLVSENRHFLEELKTEAFQVVDAAEFLNMIETGEIPACTEERE
ncbi:MAG: hypothetical protein WBW48_22050 [Anaerolineae bacterium]